MALPLYKQGQGYWTRMMSAIGAGVLVLWAGKWVWDQFATVHFGEVQPVYAQAGAFIVVALIGAFFIYRLIGRKPRSVDFLIATEGEMKKVNWSTKREIIGSTWVVIGLTFFIAVFIFILDRIFFYFFSMVGVVET